MTCKRVLVADDEAQSADLLKMIIESERADVLVDVAYDGVQAVHMADQARPDVVLMDLEMPRMDGQTAAQHIRDSYASDPPCLIALSGNINRLAELQRAGPFHHLLSKPLDVEKLFALFS